MGSIILCALTASAAWAQEISISAMANPQQAAVGQHIRLVVTIEGKVNLKGSPRLPDMPEFQVYEGGRSSNFSFVNGKISSALKFTYVLVPKGTGNFTIGPVQIDHAGRTYSTQPIQIQVGSSGRAVQPSRPSRPPVVPPGPRAKPPKTDTLPGTSRYAGKGAFITTSVDHRRVYVNEPVILTFRFFSRIRLLSQPQYQPPDTSGFWAEDLPPQRNYNVRIQGQEYQVIEIKTALFPTTAGKLTISPATLVVQTRDFRRRSFDPLGDDFFRDFFSGGQQVKLSSDPINLEVKPIPREGRPKEFSGTVGQWSLSAKLDRKQAKVGEAVTMEIRIFGEGNVKSVGKPRIPVLKGFKVYETVSSSEVQKQKGRVKGVKIYRTLIRPEVTGKLTIPPIIYNYFNPGKRRFEKLEVPSLSLEVLPGKTQPVVVGSRSTSEPVGPGVKVVAEDIRYLKTNFSLKPFRPWPAWIWIAGFLLPPIGLGALWFWQRRQDQLASDPRYARRLKAEQSARRVLRQARTQRLRRDSKAFYASLSQALTWYLADHLGISRSGSTKREIVQKLHDIGAEEIMVEKLANLFDECDFARFAPSGRKDAEMERQEQEAEDLLVKLGRILSKERKV